MMKPGGTGMPSITSLKCDMTPSMVPYTSGLGGSAMRQSSRMMGPVGIFFSAWRRILSDCFISSMRIR